MISASLNEMNTMHISLTNIDNTKSQSVQIKLQGYEAKEVHGQILTSEKVQDHNTFDDPSKIKPKEFKDFDLNQDFLQIDIPSNSVVVLELKLISNINKTISK